MHAEGPASFPAVVRLKLLLVEGSRVVETLGWGHCSILPRPEQCDCGLVGFDRCPLTVCRPADSLRGEALARRVGPCLDALARSHSLRPIFWYP
jgi:hypothetical protein